MMKIITAVTEMKEWKLGLVFLVAVDVKYLTLSCHGIQGKIWAGSQKSL